MGWNFTVIDNKPTRWSKGAVRLPEALVQEESRRATERLNSLSLRWTEASEEQKGRWLEELPGHMAAFAPAPGAEPRPVFLMALRDLVEPELPLS